MPRNGRKNNSELPGTSNRTNSNIRLLSHPAGCDCEECRAVVNAQGADPRPEGRGFDFIDNQRDREADLSPRQLQLDHFGIPRPRYRPYLFRNIDRSRQQTIEEALSRATANRGTVEINYFICSRSRWVETRTGGKLK